MTELKIVTGDLEQVVGPRGTYFYTGMTYTVILHYGNINNNIMETKATYTYVSIRPGFQIMSFTFIEYQISLSAYL